MASGPPSSPRRILAVDDDPISLAITAVLLEADGWTVLQAAGGEEALDLLAACDPPECIVADLLMPGLSGPDLASRLRQVAPCARIVAMSASPPAAVDGYELILNKPLSVESLHAALAHEPAPTQPAIPPPDGSGVLDADIFERLRRSMSTNGLMEVVVAFFQDAAMRIGSMRTGDPATVRREAHTLKGGASMIGVIQVAVAAAAVEAGIDSEGDRLRKLDEIEDHCRRAEGILMQRLKL